MVKKAIIVLCAIVLLGVACIACAAESTLYCEMKLKSSSFGNMGTRKMWLKGDSMRWEAKSVRLRIRLIKNRDGVFMIHPWYKYAAKYPDGTTRGNAELLVPGPVGPVDAYLKRVRATKNGMQKINKRQCIVYSYVDPDTRRSTELWVDAKSPSIPVQVRVKGQRGVKDSITGSYVAYKVGTKVAQSLFELPKGYSIRPMPKSKGVASRLPTSKAPKAKSG